MKHSIDWNTAEVKGEELNVTLTGKPDELSAMVGWSDWGEMFEQIANQQSIPGVSYSFSHRWGSVNIIHGLIRVSHVSDVTADSLKQHLDAAVDQTNTEYARYRQQQEREAQQRREEAARAAERDAELTNRFRQ